VLEFKKEDVFIVEKYISSCDEESTLIIGNYKWTVLDNNKIKIAANPKKIENTYMEYLTIELNNEQLLGKRKKWNNSISEYTFKDVFKQK